MHKLLDITQNQVTRLVKLQNLSTGTVDVCFDDAALLDECNSFDFMQVGKDYDCMISLFGRYEKENADGTVCCRQQGLRTVGNGVFIVFMIENDEYLIPKEDVPENIDSGNFYFRYSRKNLWAVDATVHPDYF